PANRARLASAACTRNASGAAPACERCREYSRYAGVDKIVAEAGVAPTTLYRLFGSKEDLVAVYVDRHAARYKAWIDRSPPHRAYLLATGSSPCSPRLRPHRRRDR